MDRLGNGGFMRRSSLFSIVLMFMLVSVSRAQESTDSFKMDESVQNGRTSNQEITQDTEGLQPINKDEGYGANDEEYYSAEGGNSEGLQPVVKENAF
jgi:uncharacterized protein YpmB